MCNGHHFAFPSWRETLWVFCKSVRHFLEHYSMNKKNIQRKNHTIDWKWLITDKHILISGGQFSNIFNQQYPEIMSQSFPNSDLEHIFYYRFTLSDFVCHFGCPIWYFKIDKVDILIVNVFNNA